MKAKQRGNSDAGELLIVLGILAVILAIMAVTANASCKAEWADSGFQIKWGPIAGCRISKDGTVWIPAKNLRDVK